MRYRKYHLFLDVFGLLGVALSIAYYHFGHLALAPGAVKDEELYNLWGNIATDLIGIWLSVRIIDFIIRRSEKEQSSRIGLVRNTRFLIAQIKRTVEFSGHLEFDHLNNEIAYTRRIFKKRAKHLKPDEIRDLNAFYAALDGWIPDLDALIRAKTQPNDPEKTAQLETLRKALWERLPSLQDVQRKAEENILNESDED